VKRISKGIYEDIRGVLKQRLELVNPPPRKTPGLDAFADTMITQILNLCVIYVEHRRAKTVTVQDVRLSRTGLAVK
jgi:hypothetical protein